MKNLSRSTGLKIAAVLLLAIALAGIFAVGIPTFMGYRADLPDGPPLGVVIFSFAIDAITIVIAYGVWRTERWGVISAIVISVFNAILNTAGMLGDPLMSMKILTGCILIASLFVIYLCLRQRNETLASPASG